MKYVALSLLVLNIASVGCKRPNTDKLASIADVSVTETSNSQLANAKPDLAIEDISFSGISFRVAIKNIGSGSSKPTKLNITALDKTSGREGNLSIKIDELAAGTSHRSAFEFTILGIPANGNSQVTAVVDPENSNDEENEANNQSIKSSNSKK